MVSVSAIVYGRVVGILSTACDIEANNVARLRNLIIAYVQMTAPLYLGLRAARARQTHMLEQACKLAEAGEIKPVLSRLLPLEEAAAAHRLLEGGHVSGTVVLDIP